MTPPAIFESRLIPFGRAADTLSAADVAPRPLAALDGACRSMTEHPSVFADGTVTGCAGVFVRDCTALQFGNAAERPLAETLARMRRHPLAVWIHTLGLVALKDLVERHSTLRFADRYASQCHLCGDILTNRDAVAVLARLGFPPSSPVSLPVEGL